MSGVGWLCLALAALVGPRPRGHFRFWAIAGAGTPIPSARDARRAVLPVAVACVVVAALVGSPAVLVAAGIGGAAVVWMARRAAGERETAAREAAVLRATAAVIAELSVGSTPSAACATAAAEIRIDDPTSAVGADLAALAARVQLGGEVAAASSGAAAVIAQSWAVAARFGLPLAELLVSRRADLVERQRFAARTKAGLAGPRATARVLAVLPAFGIVMGQAIGADPIGVLLAPGAGGVLLVAGTALATVGVAWSERIIERAIR